MGIDGSDKKYYFRHTVTNSDAYVFKALNTTMNKKKWWESSYVSLCGVIVRLLTEQKSIRYIRFNKNVIDNFVRAADDCGASFGSIKQKLSETHER